MSLEETWERPEWLPKSFADKEKFQCHNICTAQRFTSYSHQSWVSRVTKSSRPSPSINPLKTKWIFSLSNYKGINWLRSWIFERKKCQFMYKVSLDLVWSPRIQPSSPPWLQTKCPRPRSRSPGCLFLVFIFQFPVISLYLPIQHWFIN